MKVIRCDIDGDRATVVLRPCWLARLFGARHVVCKLVRLIRKDYMDRNHITWHHEASAYPVTEWRWSRDIMTALDFHQVEPLPRARASAAAPAP